MAMPFSVSRTPIGAGDYHGAARATITGSVTRRGR
jgi:hypothetical protein